VIAVTDEVENKNERLALPVVETEQLNERAESPVKLIVKISVALRCVGEYYGACFCERPFSNTP